MGISCSKFAVPSQASTFWTVVSPQGFSHCWLGLNYIIAAVKACICSLCGKSKDMTWSLANGRWLYHGNSQDLEDPWCAITPDVCGSCFFHQKCQASSRVPVETPPIDSFLLYSGMMKHAEQLFIMECTRTSEKKRRECPYHQGHLLYKTTYIFTVKIFISPKQLQSISWTGLQTIT